MEEINETLELSKSCNEAVNQVIELANRINKAIEYIEFLRQYPIAKWAGTTTSGTSHAGLETAVAMFNKTYGFNLKVQWKNLSDLGWSGVKKILESSNQDIVFHNLYRNQWGHYEVANSISGSTVNTQNSLGSMCTSSCYCGYIEYRSTGTFAQYMSGISQKSLMIITRG